MCTVHICVCVFVYMLLCIMYVYVSMHVGVGVHTCVYDIIIQTVSKFQTVSIFQPNVTCLF